MNRVVLIGRLTKDPELRNTNGGTPVTNFNLAVDRPFKNSQGEREADFIPIVAWRQLAENTCKFMGKGRLIAVEGRIQTRNYENEAGNRVYITEVVAESIKFLDRSKDTENKVDTGNNTYNHKQNKTVEEKKDHNDESKINDIFGGIVL